MSAIPQFVTADTHLGHPNILRHAARPYSCLEEHDEGIVANWNELVPKRAVVAVLGDFAWRDHARYLQRLNGKKILVCGSHDRMSQDALSLFKEVHKGGAMLNFGNQRIFWCSHCCPRVWERGHYGIPALFGHSHGRLETYNLSVDVGVDSGRVFKKYFPIPIEEVIAWMALREEEMRAAGRVEVVHGREMFRQDDVYWLHKQLSAAPVSLPSDKNPGY